MYTYLFMYTQTCTYFRYRAGMEASQLSCVCVCVCVWACECAGALFATLSRVVVDVVDAVTVAAVDVRVFVLDVVVYAADMELLLG